MSIGVGSKWQHKKSGEVVEVIDYREQAFKCNGFTDNTFVVWYKNNGRKAHTITECDFLNQYKTYEPVYEYRYAYKFKELAMTTACYYKDDNEFATQEQVQYYQRLDFTKRERKANV